MDKKQSNFAVVQPTRTLTGTITDYFADAPADNILLISSLDSARTNAQGEFTLEAALAEEHIPILHPSILTSGTILPASPNDTSFTLYIARGDSANGIDSTYFRDEVLSDRGGNPIPSDLIYVAMTAESAPDTAFILGYIERDDGFVVSVGFQNVAQLNRQSGVINQEGNIVTKGLYNVDSTTIDIADTVFMNPDSTALFEWVNMAPDSNNVFPVNNPEEFRKTLFIRASNNVLGGNGTFLENYAITGGTIILKKDLTPNQMEIIMKEELISHLVSGVESDIDYPSIFDKAHSILYPHDIRMINWIYFRGPGRTYPDFPVGFDPALIERHAPGVLEKIKVSKNLPVDFSKYHLDEATGIYLKK